MLIFVTSKTNQSSTTMDKLLLTLALTATHYLFVYFTGNAPEKEQVCYAVSDDGFNYSPLNNGLPIIGSDTIARAHNGIRQYVFKDIYQSSTWKLLDGFCETTKSDVEGAGVFPLINGGWCLMYDCYRDHYYQFTKSYTRNLKVFADWVRQQGGHIIFATPTARRLFNADHKTLAFTHGDYPEAMSTVARREQIPLIELNAMTRTFFTALGEEGSKQALVHYAANTFPDQSTPLADNTHFNPYGAWQVSRMVVMGLKQLQSPLADHLRPDFLPIDPSRPDSPSSFIWYMSGSSNILKPDGN